MATRHIDQPRLRRLLDVGTRLVSELDLDAVNHLVIEATQELTGAARVELNLAGQPVADAQPTGENDPVGGARLVVPLCARDYRVGTLTLSEPRAGTFDTGDEEVARVLAEWAALAIDDARLHEDVTRLRRESIRASEKERTRWARELHDETLQGLGMLQVLLTMAGQDPEGSKLAISHAVEQIDQEIEKLHRLITELRPAALDQIGLAAAIEALAERAQEIHPLEIELDLELCQEPGRGRRRIEPELEDTVYRIVQEALSNVVKHASANSVSISGHLEGDQITLEVHDDGHGFDPAIQSEGFGLLGMRERVELVEGDLELRSSAGAGSTVIARLPMKWATEASPPSS